MNINTIKWAATATLIVSVGLNGLGIYPLGPIVQISGGLLWTIASFRMKDMPLIVTNTAMTVVGVAAIVYKLFGG